MSTERPVDIEEGVYRLEDPVDNPGSDGRYTHDFTKGKTFEPGLYRI